MCALNCLSRETGVLQSDRERSRSKEASNHCFERSSIWPNKSTNTITVRILRLILIGFSGLIVALLVIWAAGALYFDLPAPKFVRISTSILWVIAALLLALFAGLSGRIALLVAFAAIVTWWLSLRPSQNQDWEPEVATLAHTVRNGDELTVYDIRDFEYRSPTDFTPHYDTRTFDLANLRGLDLFINYWGSRYMAHPILSFDFGPQGHLCFSIEIRPRLGQAYSILGSLYRQYTIIYIAADERDVVRLRTNFKHEDIYLYRLKLPLEEVRARLTEYLDRLNELYDHPMWYNAVTENCTTSIRAQRQASKRAPWDWRMLVNGFADEMLYERHVLAGNLPFPELKARALINQRAADAGDSADFSQRIRAGVPGFERAN
jgi:hypothetical protein